MFEDRAFDTKAFSVSSWLFGLADPVIRTVVQIAHSRDVVATKDAIRTMALASSRFVREAFGGRITSGDASTRHVGSLADSRSILLNASAVVNKDAARAPEAVARPRAATSGAGNRTTGVTRARNKSKEPSRD